MKYSEAKKAIESLSSKCSIVLKDFSGYFYVNYKELNIAYVSTDNPYTMGVWDRRNFHKLTFSNKLYMILAELAMTPLDERVEVKKYYVKVYDSVIGYLNINYFTSKMSVDDVSEGNGYKTKFTNKDIDELKKRNDIPLDWNKVTLEEAE